MKKKNNAPKYHAKKTIVDGIAFDSKDEAAYYTDIVLPGIVSGEFKGVEIHPKYLLIDKFEKMSKKYRKLTYSADFKITLPDNTFYLVDVKGVLTKEFVIKCKLFNFLYPEIKLLLVKRAHKGWTEID